MGSEPTSLALLSRGAGVWCQFLPPEQVRWAELDILLYFYFRTDQVKPGHMQLLRGAFFFSFERDLFS